MTNEELAFRAGQTRALGNVLACSLLIADDGDAQVIAAVGDVLAASLSSAEIDEAKKFAACVAVALTEEGAA